MTNPKALMAACMFLTLAACEKKQDNTEISTPAVEQPVQAAPVPEPAALADTTAAHNTAGTTTTTAM